MTILIDMDDVLEQLVAGWCAYLHDRYGTQTRACDVREWNMTKAFPGLTREQVYGATEDDALWDYVLPMPGAAEGLRQLLEDGHEIYVVTATGYKTLRAKMEKVLFRYFPFLDWSRVIVTENKQMIAGDILIDDGPHNLTGSRYGKILFSAGHNRSFDETSIGAIRVNNWRETVAAVRRYAAALPDRIPKAERDT